MNILHRSIKESDERKSTIIVEIGLWKMNICKANGSIKCVLVRIHSSKRDRKKMLPGCM